MDELYTMLSGIHYWIVLSGYHHITLSPEAQKKSAFLTPAGKCKFKRLPFGLAQALAHFWQLIN